MEKKKMFSAVAVVCATAMLGIIGVSTAEKNATNAIYAGGPSDQTVVFTAGDFSAGSGNVTKNGNNFAYTQISISGSTVTLGATGILYNTVSSGQSGSSLYKGNGFTSVTFAGLSVSTSDGYVQTYNTDNAPGTSVLHSLAGKSGAYTLDLTSNSGTAIAASSRTTFQLQLGATSGATISFTSMSITYACRSYSPSVSLAASQSYVQMGSTVTVTATPSEIGSATPTYSYASGDTAILTVAANNPTTSAVVTPVSVGTASVTVTMIVNSVSYTASVNIEVKSSGLIGTAISTLDQLKGVFDNTGTNTAKSYYLANDIDCATWTMGNNGMAGAYTGTFNGNGYALTHCNVINGLFNIIGTGGVVENLTISGKYAPVGDGYGYISYQNNGTVSSVTVSVYPTNAHAGALSVLAFNGSGSIKDVTENVYFAKDVNEGAFFADTCQASITPTGTCVGTYYNADGSTKLSSLIQSKSGFSISNGGTWSGTIA